MVLDADEFLNIHVGHGTVPELLDAVPDATAVLVNWRFFGSAGHELWKPELVTERFTMAVNVGNAVNLSFKTLFTRLDAYHCKLMSHGPGYADEARLDELRYFSGGGGALPNHFAMARTFLQSEPNMVSWRLAQVNHYNTRSWEDCVVKHSRGGGITRRWDRDWNWNAFNTNEERDTTIWKRLPKAKALLADLLADEAIRERHGACCRLYGEHVSALKARQRDAVPVA